MLLSDQFVFIHFPKTGGTFVTETLKKIHSGKYWESRRKKAKILMFLGWTGGRIINLDGNHYKKHATYRDIPFMFKNKKVFTAVRNPYERYVSQYEFGFWKNFPERFFFDVENMKKLYPDFKNVSFHDYVKIVNVKKHIKRFDDAEVENPEFPVGRQTYEFMNFFSKKPPQEIFSAIGDRHAEVEECKQNIAPIDFLKTETLNQEFYDFLLEIGYPPAKIEFILSSQKIFPKKGGRSEDQKWEKYYSSELKQYVRQRDSLLFELFPDYDI